MGDSNLVLSLQRQGLEPGDRSETQLHWTVPAGWQTQVLQVPEGTQVPLAVAVTTIDDGVVVEIQGEVDMKGNCVRCARPLTHRQYVYTAETYTYPDPRAKAQKGSKAPRPATPQRDSDAIETEGDELDQTLLIERGSVDLEPILRDAVFGEAPLQPLCSDGCLGICEHCGVLLEEAEPGHHHEFLDPRFSALADFFENQEN